MIAIRRANTARPRRLALGRASLPGTCGELFQGLLDGGPCLVSCPIDLCATARVSLQPDAQGWRSAQSIPKTVCALELAARRWAVAGGGRVEIESTLPSGRGYGASTADLGGALFALARAAGRRLELAEAARLAAEVEPTDSTLFPGLALFAHRAGRLLRALGPAPPLAVLVLDPGGQVDTLAYNREVTPGALRSHAAAHREAYGLLQGGLAERAWAQVGQGATLSAQTQQAILHSPWLEAALDLSRALGGLGVCRAHSGTLLGVLLDPARVAPDEALARAREHLPAQVQARLHRLASGGAQ